MIRIHLPYRNDAATGEQWVKKPSNEMDLFCFAQAAAMSAMPFFNTFKPNPPGKNDLGTVTANIVDLARYAVSYLLDHPEEYQFDTGGNYIRVEAFRPHPDDGGRIELNAYLDLGCVIWWDPADMIDPDPEVAKAA